jgi:hypothetical protein
VRKAFFIAFEMGTSSKRLSTRNMGVRYGVTKKTGRLWMHKVREAMESIGNNPTQDTVHVFEFVLGEREREKEKVEGIKPRQRKPSQRWSVQVKVK